MKKLFMLRIIIFILIICIVVSFTPVYSVEHNTEVSSYYKNMDLGILAYKQVSGFQVQLADGSMLLDGGVSTNSDLDIIENLGNVEIVFVIDTSGSMGGTKVTTTKTSTKTLVESLFDKLGADHLQIGVIFFNSGMRDVLELTNNEDNIMSQLDKIYASGGTAMSDSLQKANSMLSATPTDDNTIKIVCTLSDGALGDESESIAEFENLNSSGISTISIFVETPVTSAFANLATNNQYHKNMQTSTANLATTIVEDIYSEIYMRVILMSEPNTIYNSNNENVLIGGDKIVFQADEEILHGATLRIEYVMSIITAFNANHIKITDYYSDEFTFNSNESLLTESGTNNNYGWKIENNSLVCDSGDSGISGATEYKVKLVLSTVLTPERLYDLRKMGNYMTFSLNDIDHNQTISVDASANIKALDFLIIPPTGETDTTSEDILLLLKLSIFTLAAVIFIAFIHNKVKENRRYFK